MTARQYREYQRQAEVIERHKKVPRDCKPQIKIKIINNDIKIKNEYIFFKLNFIKKIDKAKNIIDSDRAVPVILGVAAFKKVSFNL